MHKNLLRNSLFAVITFFLVLAFGEPTIAKDYHARINKVSVDIAGETIYILGKDFNTVCPPVVLLGANPTPLTLLGNNIEEIEVVLPDVPDGDYLLQVGFPKDCYHSHDADEDDDDDKDKEDGDDKLKYYTYDLTIRTTITAKACSDGEVVTGLDGNGQLTCTSYETVEAQLDRDNDGYTVAKGDCAPNDGNAYPGSPHWSTQPKDMNCDGEIELKITRIAINHTGFSCISGWSTDNEIPTCGQIGVWWHVYNIWRSPECAINEMERTQRCR